MNEMQIVSAHEYVALLSHYLQQEQQFALIAAVLRAQQKGTVYADKLRHNFFIIHSFGFCQLLELQPNLEFAKQFKTNLENKQFPYKKLRWYDVPSHWLQHICELQSTEVNIVERARFKFERMHDIAEFSDEFSIDRINQHNFSMIEARLKLDLNSRFWPSKEDFLQNTLGAVIFHHTQPIGICYACAISNEIAEVDIYTDPSYRRQGVGQWVFAAFLQLCRERNITPHWDCYVNNIPSFDLATKLGFMPYHYYSHAIISQ